MDPQNRNQLRSQIKASVFKGSYFGGMKNPEAIKKSMIQVQALKNNQQQQIDDKTFRILPNFVKPSETFIVYKQSGRCYIQGQSFFSCFSRRRTYDIILINTKLSIRSDKIIRFVDFNFVDANIETKGKGFIITFSECSSEIYIQPVGKDSNEQSKEWVKKIREVISNSDGKTKKYNYLAQKYPLDFFKTQHCHYKQFQRFANSGDILLFKSQHSAATVQRLFTDSQYDHVGVILRNKKNQLFIYESTSDSGVSLCSWKQFIRYQWYSQLVKITWRPLNIKLNQSDISTMQNFIIKTLGKQFQINLQKLLTFKSTLSRTTQTETNKTYFCSELVARLYKQLGILDQEKASTTYYPVDFSQKGFLKIVRQGVSIGNQILLSFDKQS